MIIRVAALARELPHRTEEVAAGVELALAAGWKFEEAEDVIRRGQVAFGDGMAVLQSMVLLRGAVGCKRCGEATDGKPGYPFCTDPECPHA